MLATYSALPKRLEGTSCVRLRHWLTISRSCWQDALPLSDVSNIAKCWHRQDTLFSFHHSSLETICSRHFFFLVLIFINSLLVCEHSSTSFRIENSGDTTNPNRRKCCFFVWVWVVTEVIATSVVVTFCLFLQGTKQVTQSSFLHSGITLGCIHMGHVVI